MKRELIFALLITTFLLTSCASKSQKSKAKQESSNIETASQEAPGRYIPSLNHSYLTEENVGENITVKGKIVQNGNTYSLIENADSKSRVTFILSFDDDAVKNMLAAKVNSNAQLSGLLLAADSTWTKKMKVLKVE